MRRAALVGVGQRRLKAYCAIETALCVHARPRSDVLDAASNEQPVCACAHTSTRHRALSLIRGGAARVRRAALGEVG